MPESEKYGVTPFAGLIGRGVNGLLLGILAVVAVLAIVTIILAAMVLSKSNGSSTAASSATGTLPPASLVDLQPSRNDVPFQKVFEEMYQRRQMLQLNRFKPDKLPR